MNDILKGLFIGLVSIGSFCLACGQPRQSRYEWAYHRSLN